LGTPKVDSLLADSASRHYLSSVGVVEMHSTFAHLVRMGQITPVESHRLRGRLLSDIASGLWRIVKGTPADLQQAQQLLVHHATIRSLRTLDSLQLAVASGLNSIIHIDDFICVDANLCNVAAAEGLAIINPEIP
jgi:hypothetical protein